MKIKNIFRYLGLLLAALLLPSCAETADGPNNAKTDGTFLTLDISMENTRGELKKEFVNGDEILVLVLDQSKPTNEAFIAAQKATYDGERWQLETPINISDLEKAYAPEGELNLCIGAMYPYSKINDAIDFEEYLKDYGFVLMGNMLSQDDLLYGSTLNVTSSNPNAKITFQHALSCISVRINNATGEDIIPQQVTLSNYIKDFEDSINRGWLYNEVLMSLQGIFEGESSQNSLTNSIIAECGAIHPGESAIVNFTIPPTVMLYERSLYYSENGRTVGGLNFELQTTSGKTHSFFIPGNAWEPGKQYIYPVTIEEENEYGLSKGPVYLGFDGDDGKPLYWSDVNLGASHPWEYGNYYAWGEIYTKDYYIEDNCLYYRSDIGNIFGNPLYDAATANWGGNWRMPSKNEFEKLIDSCTWEITTIEGTIGYKVTGINGKSIFLPAAGLISSIPQFQGVVTDYWSGESYRFVNNLMSSFALTMITDTVNYHYDEYIFMVSGTRESGCPIRPVSSEP